MSRSAGSCCGDRRHRARRRRGGRGQLPRRAEDRRGDGAHARAAAAAGRADVAADARRSRAWWAARAVAALPLGQPAHDVADARRRSSATRRLHVDPQAATPQNIVIGGASGAMPPVLGWAAVTGEVAPEALLLFLIIFAWTPPHFWALALYRTKEYAKAGVPMLPVTHGDQVHPAARAALHADPVRRRRCCRSSPDERLLYLAARSCSAVVFVAYAVRIYCRLQRRSRAARPSAIRSSTSRAVRRAAGRPLPPDPASPGRVLALALAWRLLLACRAQGKGRSFKASTSPVPSFGRDLELTDHTGKPRTLADFRGKVVVVFFGFTHCPDVCPTDAGRAGAAMKQLGRMRAGAGAVRHRRSRARHAGRCAQYVPRSIRPSSGCRRRRGDRAYRQGVQGVLPEAARRSPTSYSVDHSAGARSSSTRRAAPALREARRRGRGARARHQCSLLEQTR